MSDINLKRRKGAIVALLWLCFFFSGACGLVYEVVWTRMLTLIFGASVFATSAVLTAFMGGLALGSYIFGRVVDRSRNPLRLYALFEIGIGVYAFILPFIVKRIDVLYVELFRSVAPSFYVLSLIRFGMAVGALIIPTTLMGATLPVLSRFAVRQLKDISWSTGSLYAINTFGAVLGCAAAGFFLIGRLGILRTTHIAVLMNLAIGVLVYVVFREEDSPTISDAEGEAAAIQIEESGARPLYPRWVVRLALLFFAISGFCSLAYEVLWTRALVYHINISVYAFATMLTTFLVGIALGSFIFSKVVDKIRDPLLLFCVIEVLIGISAILSLPIFGKLFLELGKALPWFGTIVWLPSSNKFVKSFLIMLFPTFLMGAAFPVVVRICVQSVRNVGARVGKIYSANTLGCILGSFAAGFVLIPLLGIGRSILLLGCVNAAMGVVLFYANPCVSIRRKSFVTIGISPILLFLGLSSSKFADVQFTSPLEDVGRTLYYKEGVGATVKVFENGTTGIKEISIDGYPVACSGNQLNWRGPEIQQALAHFPMLLHPDPKEVCIVGFGAGGTSYNVSLHDVRRITCVELSPEVPKAAPLLAEVNHNILGNPKFDLVVDDGRNYILRTEKRFDVITVDATSPKFAGNVSLYTKEFYDMCKTKLSPGGVMALWAPYHLLSRREDLMLFNTFRQSFPHFSVWLTSNRGYFILIGSNAPIKIDFRNIDRRMSQPKIRAELAAVGLNTPYEFLACYAMGEDAPDSLFEGIPVNTDDHPYIEYFKDDGNGLGEFIFDGRVSEPLVYNFGETPEEAAHEMAEYKRFMEASNYLISANYWWRKGYIGEAITRTHLALIADPSSREALVLNNVLENKYKKIYLARAAAAYEKKDVGDAMSACANILRVIPDDPDTVKLLVALRESMGGQTSKPKFMSGY